MTLILDTDHLTILERGGSDALALEIRLAPLPTSQIATTIISYEEQMRGWLAPAAQANTTAKLITAYARLSRHVDTFANFMIYPFDAAAAEQYEALQAKHIRIGTQDLKIAAICIALDVPLLTRNLKDFNKVPGLRAEDWSA